MHDYVDLYCQSKPISENIYVNLALGHFKRSEEAVFAKDENVEALDDLLKHSYITFPSQ